MKEYCLVSTRKHKIVSVLHIVKYQFEELTDEKFETLVNKWLLIAGGNCSVRIKNGDFITKYSDDNETLLVTFTEEGFDVILRRAENVLDVADCAQVIEFN